MTPRQQRFVQEYLIDLNATQAAIRAGYSAKDADVQGPRLLGNVGVAAAVKAAMDARATRCAIDQDWVLQRLVTIADADVRELVGYIRGPCDECPPHDGGVDRPNPKCKACHGRGKGRVVIADTRDLSPQAKLIYDGVQVGREGVKVNILDRGAALTNIARHLGMFADKLDVTATVKVDPDEVDRKLARAIAGAIAAQGMTRDQG